MSDNPSFYQSLSDGIASETYDLTATDDPNFSSSSLCQLNVAYSSESNQFRIRIREALLNDIKTKFSNVELSSEQRAKLLDVSIVPRVPGLAISISHSSTVGGFVVSDARGFIGFDVEVTDRVKPEIVRRVLAPREDLALGNEGHLWCAKEASVKAIANSLKLIEPPVASSIRTAFTSGPKPLQFTAQCLEVDVKVRGIAGQSGDLTWAVAWVPLSSN